MSFKSNKYTFTVLFCLTLFYFIAIGLLESVSDSLLLFHVNRPVLSSLLWLITWLIPVGLIFRKSATSAFKEKPWNRVLLEKLSSMGLAVYLMTFVTILVFVGTIGQSEMDVWEAVGTYFRCTVTRVPLSIFVIGEHSELIDSLHILLPGGYLLGAGLLINLIAAHAFSFKFNPERFARIPGILITLVGLAILVMAIWFGIVQEEIPSAYVDSYKRVLIRLSIGVSISVTLLIGCWLLFKKNAGLVILHFGIILLLMSELITALYAKEGSMRIKENSATAYFDINREFELAFTDLTDSYQKEKSFVIPIELLRNTGEWQSSELLPFDFKVNRFLERSSIFPRRVRPPQRSLGLIQQYDLKDESTDPTNKIPAAEITFRDKSGNEFATMLFSLELYYRNYKQRLAVDHYYFDVMLRPKREYLYSSKSEEPFSIKLLDFRFDKYVGTNEAKNFSSLVKLVDPSKGIDRKILISMNNPLRYSGRTFYQSSFFQDETGTVLTVVENPGWMIPYICCMMVGIGMLYHFGNSVTNFARARK